MNIAKIWDIKWVKCWRRGGWRKVGHRVIRVGHAVVAAGLIADEGGQCDVANARLTIGILSRRRPSGKGRTEPKRNAHHSSRDARTANRRNSHGGKSSAETVAGDNDAVRGIGRVCGVQSTHDIVLDVYPGSIESTMHEATATQAPWNHWDHGVVDEVLNRLRPPE